MAADQERGLRNLVLLGKTGNGKSATGNSILGLVSPSRKKGPVENPGFISRTSASSITQTTEMKTAKINDQTINVIDTPGLFDTSTAKDEVTKEIVKCMQMAKGGVHAFIAVLRTERFTKEEAMSFEILEEIFGSKALDYMIVVFTSRSDDIEDMVDLELYLKEAPQSLNDLLDKCKHRKVLFDNLAKDKKKQQKQRSDLLLLVNQVVAQNHNQPYNNDLIKKLQEEEKKRKEAEKEMEAARQRMEISKYEEMKNKIQKEAEETIKQIREKLEARLEEEIKKRKSKKCCSVM